MGWTFFYLFVILKIPVIAAFVLIWWAVRDEPAEDEQTDGEGGSRRDPHPRRPGPPRPPRRGAHAPSPASPSSRVRATGKQLDPSHR